VIDGGDAVGDGDTGKGRMAVKGVHADGGDGTAAEFIGYGQFARVGGAEADDGGFAVPDSVSVGAEGVGGQDEREKEEVREREGAETR